MTICPMLCCWANLAPTACRANVVLTSALPKLALKKSRAAAILVLVTVMAGDVNFESFSVFENLIRADIYCSVRAKPAIAISPPSIAKPDRRINSHLCLYKATTEIS